MLRRWGVVCCCVVATAAAAAAAAEGGADDEAAWFAEHYGGTAMRLFVSSWPYLRSGLPSSPSNAPPAASRIAWPAAVSHSQQGEKRG